MAEEVAKPRKKSRFNRNNPAFLFALAAFLLLIGIGIGAFTWYGFRVYTELRPGSWRTPTAIIDSEGHTLVALYGSDWKLAEPVVLSDLPDYVPNAFLAAEDARFRSHIGIDPVGIGRAIISNAKAGGVAEGGSTITQQLAKNRFLSQKRTITRKIAEAGIALMIEARLSKDEILEAYLNEVYLGHRDGREIRGLGEASRIYFNKPPKKLTVAEAALLAGMIRAPNRDNPDERSSIAKERRDAVLKVMLDKKWIDQNALDKAVATDAEFHPGPPRLRPYPYLLAALRQEFIDKLGERRLADGNFRIYTSIDGSMQRAAEAAVRTGTQRLRATHPWLRRKKPLQGALLSMDPATGGIRALVGGSDFRRSQFDRTRLMRRQPGSAAKPFTYAAAIESRSITPSTILQDEPITIQLASNKTWEPKDYDQQFRGPVTVREAFEKSLNVPAVRVAQQTGVSNVQEVLHKAGITGDLSETPAIALGVDEVSMRELISAYSTFANLGSRVEPYLIEKIEQNGGDIYTVEQQKTEVMDPAVAYVINSLMRGVVIRGTAAALNQYGLGNVAGKTGTTSNYRDAWFVGYVPDLLTVAWVGFDDGTPLRMSSGEAVVPMWASYMSKTRHSSGELSPPQGVTIAQIDVTSGQLWQPSCGPQISEAYLSGTEPHDMCGTAFEGDMMAGYQEPAMISEQEAMAMAQDAMSGMPSQVVVDPADTDSMTDDDTLEVAAPDSFRVDIQQETQRIQQETQRQIEERARRERSRVIEPPQPQPQTQPPANPRPPVDSAPAPVKRDTIPVTDSLSSYR
jgi:1A family penicillin-binding protein